MDRKWIAGVAALTVMVCSGITVQAAGVQAQTTKPGSTMPEKPGGTKGTMKGTKVEGRVRDVKERPDHARQRHEVDDAEEPGEGQRVEAGREDQGDLRGTGRQEGRHVA